MHRTLKVLLAVATAAALLVGTAGASSAQVDGGGGGGRGRSSGDGPPDFEGGGHVLHPIPGQPGLPGDGTTTTCTAPDGTTGPIEHRPPPMPQQYYFDHASDYFAPGGQYAGTWYARYCGGHYDQIVFVPGGGGPTLGLLEDVVDLTVALPDIQMSPDETGRQLVGLETWLWIDQWKDGDQAVSNRYPGLTIVIDATPGTVTWDVGDGTPAFDCDRGRPYDPTVPADQQTSDCHHVYTRSSAHQPDGRYTVRATVHWTARVTVNGRQLPGVLTADKTSTMNIRVGERQALNSTPGRT